jgi:hypothetical protein
VTVAVFALCLLAEHDHGLPAGLLTAVVAAETGGRSVVARGRGAGRRGCDVGVAQIHVPGCRPATVRAVLDPAANLARAALILSWSRLWCARRRWSRRCHERGRWHRYNTLSATWWPTVRRLWRFMGLDPERRRRDRPES